MKVGTLLKIKPEWLNPGESEDTLYRCVEDNGDRIVIELRDCDLPIPPQEIVPADCVYEVSTLQEGRKAVAVNKLYSLPEVNLLYRLLQKVKGVLTTNSTSSTVRKFSELAIQNNIDFEGFDLNVQITATSPTDVIILAVGDNGAHDLAPFMEALIENKLASKLVKAYSAALEACQKYMAEAEIVAADVKAVRAINRIKAKYNVAPGASVKALRLSKDVLNWLATWISTISVQMPDLAEAKAYFRDLTNIDPDTYVGSGLSLVKMMGDDGKVKRTKNGALMKFNISSKASLYPEHDEVPSELLSYYNEAQDAFTSNELIIDTLLSAYGDTFTLGKQPKNVDTDEAAIAVDEALTFNEWYEQLSRLY